MNKLKTFTDFEIHIQGDENQIFNKLQILGDNESFKTPFKRLSSIEESNGSPIVCLTDIKLLNESILTKSIIFNKSPFHKKGNIFSKFIKESFIPKSTSNRKTVKSLSFPIIASGNGKSTIYETYGKFKKSENVYSSYREKIIPKTKYDVILLKNKPISICENINGKLINKKMNSSFNKSLSKISDKILEKYKLDTFYIRVNETVDGKIYLNKINKITKLNETQSNKLYISLYESYYGHSLPQWFKNKMNKIC